MLWEPMMKSFLQSKVHARALRDEFHSPTMLLLAMLHTARFIDSTKKKLQQGLHIHFPFDRVILQREGFRAKQSLVSPTIPYLSHIIGPDPFLLISLTLPKESYVT